MALDNFKFTIDNMDILDNEVVERNPERYGAATNVVYGIYSTAHAEKDGYTVVKPVSVLVPFVNSESFVDYSALTEEQVISWLEQNLTQQFGEDFITKLQAELETQIESSKPAPKNIPWAK